MCLPFPDLDERRLEKGVLHGVEYEIVRAQPLGKPGGFCIGESCLLSMSTFSSAPT